MKPQAKTKAMQESPITERMIQNALAQQKLEGLVVSAAAEEDLRQVAAERLSLDDAIEKTRARYVNDKPLHD